MTLTVKLFAILRERAGASEVQLDLPVHATVATARDALAERAPAIRDFLPRVAWAVNQAYVPLDTELHDGDELAAIPAVSGG
jgi:molybdopterin converting factor subunit 1